MKGKILYFSEQANKGQISGYDGQRYSFVKMDVLSDGTIKEGMEVDFIVEDEVAKEIYVSASHVYVSASHVEDKAGYLLIGVCALVPIVGLILYFMWKSTEPKKAKAVGLAALIGFIVFIFFYFIGLFVAAVLFDAIFYYW